MQMPFITLSERAYLGRVHGTTLHNPDFLQLGDAYGDHTEHIATTTDFERTLTSKTGVLLDLTRSVETITPHQTLTHIHIHTKAPPTHP